MPAPGRIAAAVLPVVTALIELVKPDVPVRFETLKLINPALKVPNRRNGPPPVLILGPNNAWIVCSRELTNWLETPFRNELLKFGSKSLALSASIRTLLHT